MKVRVRLDVVLKQEERSACSALVERLGEAKALEACGVSRQTLYRALAGLPVRRSSARSIVAATKGA